MRVGLVAVGDPAEIRFVGRVYVRVLLPVRAVGETTVTSGLLAAKRLLAWTKNNNN